MDRTSEPLQLTNPPPGRMLLHFVLKMHRKAPDRLTYGRMYRSGVHGIAQPALIHCTRALGRPKRHQLGRGTHSSSGDWHGLTSSSCESAVRRQHAR